MYFHEKIKMHSPKRVLSMQIDGFTMIEVMTTVLLVSIMATAAVPHYIKTVERSRWNQARETVLSIYNSEHVYNSFNLGYYPALGVTLGPCDVAAIYAVCRDEWATSLYMEDPNTYPSATAPVVYTVEGILPGFSVEALRQGGEFDSSIMSLDQDRVWAGTWGDPPNNIPP